jgi:hypothetical protein
MSSYSVKTRNIASTWFNLFFCLLLLSYLVFIEFFQGAQVDRVAVNLLSSPVKVAFISKVDKIEFKNRLGSVKLVKDKNIWLMKEPRIIPAKEKTITRLLEQIKTIKIRTIHQNEPINFKSFSLNNPVVELKLSTAAKSIDIKVGLINPIDNTSYMTISSSDHIYQTNLFDFQLERLDLADFIESKVFSVQASEVARISIYQRGNSTPFNVLEWKKNNWLSKRYRPKKYNNISNANTTKKLNDIFNIKTHMIIDKSDEKLTKKISNYLGSPFLRIVIKTRSGETLRYKVSTLIKGIQKLKIEKKQYFIMSASNRDYPFLIHKSYLDQFTIKYSDLRK